MKKTFLVILFSISLIAGALAQPGEEKKVEAAVEKLKEAMISGERKQLESIAAPELSYGHSGNKVENKAEFVEAIASGNSDFVSIELANQTIKVAGSTAIVRHVLTGKTNDKGVPGAVNLRILLIFQKQHGDWKLLARQAVKN